MRSEEERGRHIYRERERELDLIDTYERHIFVIFQSIFPDALSLGYGIVLYKVMSYIM